ncbi:hypothetical protein N7533_011552 [Penicillium manginii]|jgi:hypothetical protein|uniref:uncharacterized protein n=1 Tax=Penicillium manginii TaxID=203109 RepID=UPI002546A63E|nr:uncharacterized protein N7533_011552 [Penicillium manginii]KAJ5742143.1 hypothetical protein N7533_011552 [Penicillium manginii]
MRATPVSLVSFALLFGLANTAGAYDSTCKPPLTGEQEVEPVVMATYSCSRWGDGNHYTGHNEPAGTPKDCAIACSKRSPEGPCTWYSNTCYFYKPGAPTVAAASAHSEAVTIETRKDWDRLKLAYDQCDANCQSSGGNGGPPGGGGNDQDKGLAWPAGCQ